MNTAIRKSAPAAIAVTIICILYSVLSLYIEKPAFPPLTRFANISLWKSFGLEAGAACMYTLPRWLVVFAIATGAGVIVGLVIAMHSRWYRTYFAPTIDFFRSIPATALFTFFSAAIGIASARLAPPAYIAFFTVLFQTAQAVADFPKDRVRHLRELGASWLFVIRHCIVFEIADDLLTGVRQSLSLSFLVMVSTELLLGNDADGIGGYLSTLKYRTAFTEQIMLIVVLGCIGALCNSGVAMLHKYLVYWDVEKAL